MNYNKGFTLIELSMSLIIITLLVGLATTAISVIQSAEDRKVIADYNFYKTAINNFKLQYNQFPGDFTGASSYWSGSSICPSSNCNGNGNGIIEYVGANLTNDESLRAWQHLVFAGFVSANHTGLKTSDFSSLSNPKYYNGTRSTSNLNIIGLNVPPSQIVSAGWAFYQYKAYSNNVINSLIFGAAKSGSLNDGPAITTRSAFSIDTKIDDGSARTGNVLGLYSDDSAGNYGTGASGSNVCVLNSSTTNNISANGYYYVNTDNGQPSCALQFMF